MFLTNRFHARLRRTENLHCLRLKTLRRQWRFVVFVFHIPVQNVETRVDKKKRSQYEDDARDYLDKVSDRYIFDGPSGIYKQKASNNAENRNTIGHYKESPLWVNVQRDWLIVTISAFTLILLILTVIYTRRQWLETNRSANATEVAAHAAHDASVTAGQSLAASLENFRKDQRPYIGLSKTGVADAQIWTIPGDANGQVQIYWNIPLTNYGKSPSKDQWDTEEMKLAGEKWKNNSKNTERINPGAPLVPTGESTDSILSRPMSLAEAQKFLSMSDGVMIRTVIHYSDSSGVGYETGICFKHSPSGLPGYCREGNYIK